MTAANPPVARLQLGQLLRELREGADKKRDDAAQALECQVPKVRKIEIGKATISPGDVRLLLDLYSVSDERRDVAVQLAREGRKRSRVRVPDWARRFVAMERISGSVRNYENELVPGLLQTESYAQAVAVATAPEPPQSQIDRLLEVRAERQSHLYSEDGPLLAAVINESVIRRPVGGSETMSEQLQHLRKLSDLPSVTLQILPFSAGAHAALGASFAILGLREPAGAKMIFSEDLANAGYIDNSAQIEQYDLVFDHLMSTALNSDDSIALLEQSIQEFA